MGCAQTSSSPGSSLAFPNPPTLVAVTVAAPFAGADWAYTIPAGVWARLLTGFCTLATSSTVANRLPGLQLQNATPAVIGKGITNTAITANLTPAITYARAAGWTLAGGTVGVNLSMPALILPPGYTIGSITPLLQAGDQYSAIQLLFEEWTSLPLFDALTPTLS